MNDPLVSFSGPTATRSHASPRTGTTQPLFLSSMRDKCPPLPGQSAPRMQCPYSKYFTAQDKLDQQVFLTSKLEMRRFRSVPGEVVQLQRLSKPELLLAQQQVSRCTHPTLYDLNPGTAALQCAAFTTFDLQR